MVVAMRAAATLPCCRARSAARPQAAVGLPSLAPRRATTARPPTRGLSTREPARSSSLAPPAAIPYYINPESPEPFLFYNTIVLIPWMLMIIAPKWDVTKKLLGPTWFMVPYAVVRMPTPAWGSCTGLLPCFSAAAKT